MCRILRASTFPRSPYPVKAPTLRRMLCISGKTNAWQKLNGDSRDCALSSVRKRFCHLQWIASKKICKVNKPRRSRWESRMFCTLSTSYCDLIFAQSTHNPVLCNRRRQLGRGHDRVRAPSRPILESPSPR